MELRHLHQGKQKMMTGKHHHLYNRYKLFCIREVYIVSVCDGKVVSLTESKQWHCLIYQKIAGKLKINKAKICIFFIQWYILVIKDQFFDSNRNVHLQVVAHEYVYWNFIILFSIKTVHIRYATNFHYNSIFLKLCNFVL